MNGKDFGTYDGVNIRTIICKHIEKYIGCVTYDCDDFPHSCKECKHNKYNFQKAHIDISPVKSKSYFQRRKKDMNEQYVEYLSNGGMKSYAYWLKKRRVKK